MNAAISYRRAAAVAGGLALAAALVAVAPLRAANVNAFNVRPLVSSGVPAASTDANLVNPWGLVAGPTTPWWTANNGSDTSTLYGGDGAKRALTVAVAGGTTGTVFNGSATQFVIPGGTASGRFIFASEDGKIRAWPGSGTATTVTVDSSARGAVYKGLANAT